jgi:hypothetical protein
LSGDHTAVTKGVVEELEVWFLEKTFSWPFWIGRVRDDNIERVLVVLKEFKTISDVYFDSRVLESDSHGGQVFLRKTNDGLIDVAKNSFLDTRVFNNFTKNTTVSPTDNEDLLGIRVRVHGEMGNHFLIPTINPPKPNWVIRKLVPLSSLNNPVKNKHVSVIGTFKDQDILVL